MHNYLPNKDKAKKIEPKLKETDIFKDMIEEVDMYKKNITDEFDELQYLIKYVKNTNKKVDRHMKGINNLYEQAKIKKNNKLIDLDYSFDSNNENSNNYRVYKERNLNKIKDNLLGITGNVISYHQDLRKNMDDITYKNREVSNYIKNYNK